MTATKLDFNYPTNQDQSFYNSFNLKQSAGKAVICLQDKIVIVSEGGTQETIAIKPDYNSYDWHPNSKNVYAGWMRWHTQVFYVPDIRNQDKKSWTAFPSVADVKTIITSDTAAIARTGKNGFSGFWLTTDGKITPISLDQHPQIKAMNVNHGNTFVLTGDTLYIGFRDGHGAAEVNLTSGSLASKSDGLNLTDASGNNPNSASCELFYDYTTSALYAQTEHGQYRLNGSKWEEINPAWHGGGIYVIAPGEVALTARQGTLLYKAVEDKYYPQTILDAGYTRNVVKVGNDLISFVRHGGSDLFFAPYFLSTPIKSVPRKEITKIQESLIFQPQDAVKYNGKLYVASKGSGFVEIDGIEGDVIKVISPEPTLAVALRGNVILAVTRSLLISYNPSTAKTEVIKSLGKELNGARLAASTLYTVIVENVGENGNQFAVYDSNYKEVFRWGESGTYLQDVQISNNEIYVAGFSNRTRRGVPVQVAFLKVFDASKSFQIVRSGWNFDPESLGNDMADARLYRIQLVGDKLYVLGESAGGNSVFRWNGFDLKTQTIAEGVDWFSLGTKTKANHISYTGVLAANTLKVISGQFTLTRADSMDGNALRAKTLLVNEDSVFVGGMAAYKVQGRDSRKVLGQTLPKYGDVPGDASLLTLSADLNGSRKDWQAIAPADNVIYFDGSVALIEFKGQLKKVDF